MVKYYFIFFVILVGCNFNRKTQLHESSHVIENDSLIKYIIDYMDRVKIDDEEKILAVTIERSKDIETFEVSWVIDAFTFKRKPPVGQTSLNGETILFAMRRSENYTSTDEYLWFLLKDEFKDQFEYFKKNNLYRPPTTTYIPSWKIIVKKDSIISIEKQPTVNSILNQ